MSPAQTRWTIKRKLDQSMGNLDKSIEHLGEAAAFYEKPHPEIFDALLEIAKGVKLLRALIEPIRDRI